MSKHKRKQDHRQPHHKDKTGFHKDWRTWSVVILMIIAIGAYVLSMDEAIQPFGETMEVPAAESGE